MLVSSSDGCCLDGLVAAILFRAAAMIAVRCLGDDERFSWRGGKRRWLSWELGFFDVGLCAGLGASLVGALSSFRPYL